VNEPNPGERRAPEEPSPAFPARGPPGTTGDQPELTVTMSTRTLVRWATLAVTFKGAPKVLEYALTQALTARAEPKQKEAIHRIAADIMGDYWQPQS